MPSLLHAIIAFISGLFVLTAGAEALIGGSMRLAWHWGVSPLVIGLTIVAFGTSAPELGVALSAAISGRPDLTMGNLVGSNIANIGLILGLGALIRTIPVHLRLLKIEIPILLGVSLGVWGLGAYGSVSRWWGIALFMVFSLYTWKLYRHTREEPYDVQVEFGKAMEGDVPVVRSLLMVAFGLVGLIGGSKLLVFGAVALARHFAISELIIGLTLTAIGTSLPEIATTISAARRGHGDIIIGNIVGSNLANLAAVLGITATIAPVSVNSQMVFRDLPIMAGFSLILWPLMYRGKQVTRIDGMGLILLYGCYIAYISYLTVRP